MSDFTKIEYYDLQLEKRKNRLPKFFGREKDIQRLLRVLVKQNLHHTIIVGDAGIGKSAFARSAAAAASSLKIFEQLPVVELKITGMQQLSSPNTAVSRFRDAFATVGAGIIVINGFGELVHNQPAALHAWAMLCGTLFNNPDIKLILTAETKELEWIIQQAPNFVRNFEIQKLEQQPQKELEMILQHTGSQLKQKTSIQTSQDCLQVIIQYCKQFTVLGQLPRSAIQLFDECVAETISKKQTHVTKDIIDFVVSEKTGVPLSSLSQDQKSKLKSLGHYLEQRVIGQQAALGTITSVIQRATLGLKNKNRPLGSFLLLGPSGVGKTETAKALAEFMFGESKSFLRIDMSEFSEPHTVARLVGSPPGYVGFDAGGQLTNHLKTNPHSLILLDEIEKAHPKIFDIFLQAFDDGRLTSGQGETVDATHAIFMATSNLAVTTIIEHFVSGGDIPHQQFLHEHLLPLLNQNFRTEFLNRFDSILAYKPLSTEDLTDIALLEIKKIEQRVAEHNITFAITREILEQKIATLADPRLGARPVKRFVEEICENLITQQLLQ